MKLFLKIFGVFKFIGSLIFALIILVGFSVYHPKQFPYLLAAFIIVFIFVLIGAFFSDDSSEKEDKDKENENS